MTSLIKTTIKRPVTVCVLVIIVLVCGVLATTDMSTNLLPNIKLPMMGITVIYPGAGAQSVQDDVTSVMENALQTVPGITELETSSYDNVSVAILTFDYGTDLDEKIDAIEETFKTVTFPDGCNDPAFVKIDMNGTATATVAVFAEASQADLLTQAANALATKMRSIEGVGSVDVFGTTERQIKITSLEGLDITSLLIVQALSTENLDIPIGTIMQDGTTVSIRNASKAKNILEVMQIPATLELGSGVLSSVTAAKNGAKAFATCTLEQFEDYVQKARDALSVIEEIEGKTADELEEQQDSLAAVKSLMGFIRNNAAWQIRWTWNVVLKDMVTDPNFQNATDEDLEQMATENISVDMLKWLRDSSVDGTLEQNVERMAQFREIFPTRDENADGTLDGNDITYDQFAYLFQNGATNLTVTDDQGTESQVTFEGMDLLHSDEAHASCHVCNSSCPPDCPDKCTREIFDHDQAVDVCNFADSVNTVAYNDIIATVRNAEESIAAGEEVQLPIISDSQFAALFFNSTQGNDFAALVSPQVIHVIRQDNFDDGTENSVVNLLTKSKREHVCLDAGENYGKPVYKNGEILTRNDDDEIVVFIGGKQYSVNPFGRLVDGNDLVDGQGNKLTLTNDQIAQNYYSYGGYVLFTDQEFLSLYQSLNTDADLGITPTLDTIRLLRICDFSQNVNKLIVPVAYIGHVFDYQDVQSYAQYNGLAAVTVKVFAVSDANTTQVVNNVKKVIAQNEWDCNVRLLDDKAQFINESISNVLSSIIVGGVLAVLVIYLFVRQARSSLVVSITMPLSVLVALLGLWAMKITLNMVSLGGLAVGIGMLVDNSIVVLESISKHRDSGKSVFDSCLQGTREVAGSLLASTLTNICVFFPILFAKGLTREIFYDLVWAVIFSIVMSLFVAVTVIPSLYHLLYNKTSRPRYKRVNGKKVLVGSFEQDEPHSDQRCLLDGSPAVKSDEIKTESQSAPETTAQPAPEQKPKETAWQRWHNPKGIHKTEKAYGRILSKMLSKRIWVCVVALVVFGASVGLVFATGTEFMPSVDKGLIEINMTFDASATFDDIVDEGVFVANKIKADYGKNVDYVSLTVGKQGILATDTTNVLRVQLKGKISTSKTAQEIRTMLEKSNLKANTIVTEVDGVVAEVTGGMSGQSVTLLCDDMELLAEVAGKVANRLQQEDMHRKGIVSVSDKTAKKTQQISFVFDKEQCANRNVDYQNAVLMLRVGMAGHTAATIKEQGNDVDVVVQFGENTQTDLNNILNIVVGFDDDGAVAMKDVLKTFEEKPYVEEEVVSVISKKNGKYVTIIALETYQTDTGSASKAIASAVHEVLANYPTVVYEEGGVAAYLTDAFNGLVVSLVAAFFLLYGVMACQFESLLKPFIVIMSIPLGFTGGFLALALTGTTLNVVSFVGLIMLMGVIVNDAIVLVDKIDMLIEEGKTPQQAVVEGSKSRLRPILMTSLTTILALIPLALGLGSGDKLMQPMGIVVIGGLTLGTMVTLVLIPSFYCIIKRISFKKQLPNADATPETPISAETNSAE